MKEEDENNSQPSGNDGEIENVRVVVRVRPMDKSEMESGCENVVRVDKMKRCITVTKPNAPITEPPKIYYFDSVFSEDSKQVCMILQINLHSNYAQRLQPLSLIEYSENRSHLHSSTTIHTNTSSNKRNTFVGNNYYRFFSGNFNTH